MIAITSHCLHAPAQMVRVVMGLMRTGQGKVDKVNIVGKLMEVENAKGPTLYR